MSVSTGWAVEESSSRAFQTESCHFVPHGRGREREDAPQTFLDFFVSYEVIVRQLTDKGDKKSDELRKKRTREVEVKRRREEVKIRMEEWKKR